jgi:low affinity Fe/Cu permease
VSNETHQDSFFDHFAEAASEFASHAVFFLACVLLVVLWVPSYFLFQSLNTWQLVINTATTIVTFLLVALLQNSQRRSEQAVHQKLDALADGLADLMEHSSGGDDDLRRSIAGLRRAVGIERPQ